MKILLDENLPVRLKTNFGINHEVYTVRDMAWLGIKNGALMKLIILNNFQIFVTSDTNLQYQQNLIKFPFTVVVLKTVLNKYKNLHPLIKTLISVLENPPIEKVIIISKFGKE